MVCLSFDIEEFDMPLEYGGTISFDEQIAISRAGTQKILQLLESHKIKATFFSTVIFAENNRDIIETLLADGHELASHTYHHSQFEIADLAKSRKRLEEIGKTEVRGLRMPRMAQINARDVAEAGYLYSSSVNPTFLPGRYNNLSVSRKIFREEGLLQIPASVSANFRFPLFWLSFHHLPNSFYQKLAAGAIKKDGYLNAYFHPWEFAEIAKEEFRMPKYTVKGVGAAMEEKFSAFLAWINEKNYRTATLAELAAGFGKNS